jgi:hypothetical protein
LLTIEGGEFYIGALEWWLLIGEDTVLNPIYYWEEGNNHPCSMSFLTPPMPAETYPVHVFYGWPPFEHPLPEESAVGTFTYEPFDGAVGEGFCRSDYQCEPFLESCDLGVGRCVPAVCNSLFCGLCDHIEGCLEPEFICESSEDCRLIRSACGCHAVHQDDPRTNITSCALGGCQVCTQNHCDVEQIEAVCQNDRCIERRGDLQGLSCQRLEPEPMPGEMTSDGWIRGVRAASMGDMAALVWTQPLGSPYYRYGVVRVALIDDEGQIQGPIANLAVSNGRDSNPCVAADETGYGVAWIYEQAQASIAFQRIDSDGTPLGEIQSIETNPDPFNMLQILEAPEGFDLFWSEDDGFYHTQLDPQGSMLGTVDHVSWMIPDSGQMDVVHHRDSYAVAWSNRVYGFEGLYWTEFPLASRPVWQLSETGAEVSMVSIGQGFAVVWRQSQPAVGGDLSSLHFQSFDQDGNPLSASMQLAQHKPLIQRPRISYLGGVLLVTWMEQDGYDDNQPGRIKYLQITETGTRLGLPEELETASPSPADHFHVRFNDNSAILVGFVEPGDNADTLRFSRFNCRN